GPDDAVDLHLGPVLQQQRPHGAVVTASDLLDALPEPDVHATEVPPGEVVDPPAAATLAGVPGGAVAAVLGAVERQGGVHVGQGGLQLDGGRPVQGDHPVEQG